MNFDLKVKLIEFTVTCLTCSVLTLSAISCDRFVAVYFPLRSRVTKSRTKLVIIIIWLISIVVSMPFLVTRKYYIFQVVKFNHFRDYIYLHRLIYIFSGKIVSKETALSNGQVWLISTKKKKFASLSTCQRLFIILW